MTGAGEMIAGAVVKQVAGKLSQAAWERMGGMLWNFKDDVQDMENKMVTLQVALSYADKRSRGRGTDDDALAQHWLKKYKSVAYDIEDAMDELEANATLWKRSPVKLCFSSINPLIVRIAMSNKMRSIRLQLDKIADDVKKFNFLPSSVLSIEQANNEMGRETYIGSRDDVQMVGREREKKQILKLLQNYGDLESSIIPIVGLGGMGKTTIAKFVYTVKETHDFHFELKAWVYVSMDFKLEKVIVDIISQLDDRIPVKDATLHHLKSQLDQILDDKVYLIVLDDLWEERVHALKELVAMLQSGKKGSKIVVTTRSEKVASILSIVGSPYFHIVDPIKLEGLSDDECWSILKPPNLGDDQIIHFVDTGKEIAKQCNGVPLVAKALGYLLRKNCTREAWLEIKYSNIMDIKDDDKGILKGLLLSYHHMPPQLKLCFMYCSIFPKGHDIDHDSLIQQWIALGFIQGSDGKLLQQIGIEYVNEFLEMSFLNFLTHPTVSSARIFKPTQRFCMHDMVHDLARHVAGDDLSYTNGAESINAKRDKLNCNYHLLINLNKTSSACIALSTKVRAMHFSECDKLQLPEQAFSHTLYLRVLDSSGCHVSNLPVSVYKLKLLRYLDASTLPISKLPKSFSRLLNLQTLILSNTSLNSLPTNIGCLQKLEYFDLSGCVSLCELPISFGNLSSLLFLNLERCHELHTLPRSLGELYRLQFLNLSDCYKLQSLPESCSQLHDLSHLDMSDCHNLKELPDWIDKLSKLEYLNMTSCSKVQILPDSLCKLTMLKHLNLSFCVKLEHLPSAIGDLRLQSLDIEGCLFLGSLPDSIFNMSTLETFQEELTFALPDNEIEKLKKSLNLQGSFELDGESSDIWTQIAKLLETLCHELRIIGLENVEHLEGAEHGKLSTNSKLKKLYLGWEHDKDSMVEHAGAATAISVLAKLLPPRSLQHLGLRGYMGTYFPRWMLDISSYLPHLSSIYLIDLKECNCIPPLGRLPNLRALALREMPNIKNVGREFYGDYGSCQKLRVIYLESMDSLEEWWTTRSSTEEGEFLIPNLHMLLAKDCPKLKFLPYPPRSMSWALLNSDHVLPEHGFGNLPSTTSPFFLVIGDTSLSSEGWRRRTQHLSSIEGLHFDSVIGLRTLPDAVRCFKSLRKLVIVMCEDLETLPEWLGELTSLREICIDECRKLSSLPESLRGLTELKKLRIIDCPELLEKCLGEDKHKIAHIPEVTSK